MLFFCKHNTSVKFLKCYTEFHRGFTEGHREKGDYPQTALFYLVS